jgi:DNA-directed RNA polymerase III subunit RPC1
MVAARIVKAVIEKTSFGEFSEYMKEVYSANKCYISISLDLDAIEQLKLNVDAVSVRRSILRGTPGVTRNASLRSLKDSDVQIKKGSRSKFRVHVPAIKTAKEETPIYFAMQMLKTALPSVIIQGIHTVNRAIINETDKHGKASYNLLMEGYGLLDVMGSPGIDGVYTTRSTNHVLKVETVLGVEAARTQISAEISNIISDKMYYA